MTPNLTSSSCECVFTKLKILGGKEFGFVCCFPSCHVAPTYCKPSACSVKMRHTGVTRLMDMSRSSAMNSVVAFGFDVTRPFTTMIVLSAYVVRKWSSRSRQVIRNIATSVKLRTPAEDCGTAWKIMQCLFA